MDLTFHGAEREVTGFMAQNTLGRPIIDQGTAYEQSGRSGPSPILKFLNTTCPLNAHVTGLGGFSAPGDKQELLWFINESNLTVKRIAVVHGEENQALAFAGHLRQDGYPVLVPKRGETFRMESFGDTHREEKDESVFDGGHRRWHDGHPLLRQ
jgi:metallo-beta-lactamase family protein